MNIRSCFSLFMLLASRTSATDSLERVDPSGQQIRFWHQHTRERKDALEALIRKFNETNPHKIEISAEYAGQYSDIYNKMIAGLRTGDVAHLIVAYQNQAVTYSMASGLVDLQPYVDSDKWGLTQEEKDDYFPAFYEQDMAHGIRLGFPPNRSMEVLYYNVDWLKELGFDTPPRTWEQFREMVCAAKGKPFSKSLLPGASIGYQLSIDTSRFAAMVFSRGGSLANKDNSAYTLNTPEARETLEFLQNLFKEGCAKQVAERYGDQADFGAGSLLFSIASSSGLPFYKLVVDHGAQFQWDVAALPQKGETPIQNIYGASLSIPKTTPQQQLAAWLFIRWFTSPAQQAQWAQSSNYFPVRKSVALQMEDYFEKNIAYKHAFDLLQYGTFEPLMAGYDLVRDLIEQTMASVVDGKPAVPALQKLEKEANAILSDYY